MVSCPFRTLVVVYQMFTFITCLIWLMSGYCFHIYPPPLDASVQRYSFLKTNWIIQKGPPLYQIYILNRIISRGVTSFATGSHCGVWGRGWTTCLHLFLVSLCFYISRVLPVIFLLYILLWQNFFLHKVLCTTIVHIRSLNYFLSYYIRPRCI